ncbi:hypothetical protein IWQ62_004102 [Dispira parvispora]|uniref:Uncharacterized protein n=1 Tax=Dispira parvispora TaxID=1520584 RepID=A0A9W8APP6_9FUNG|nr:hypothetical protein IWQ62_004102 [Dispira parvispora]
MRLVQFLVVAIALGCWCASAVPTPSQNTTVTTEEYLHSNGTAKASTLKTTDSDTDALKTKNKELVEMKDTLKILQGEIQTKDLSPQDRNKQLEEIQELKDEIQATQKMITESKKRTSRDMNDCTSSRKKNSSDGKGQGEKRYGLDSDDEDQNRSLVIEIMVFIPYVIIAVCLTMASVAWASPLPFTDEEKKVLEITNDNAAKDETARQHIMQNYEDANREQQAKILEANGIPSTGPRTAIQDACFLGLCAKFAGSPWDGWS